MASNLESQGGLLRRMCFPTGKHHIFGGGTPHKWGFPNGKTPHTTIIGKPIKVNKKRLGSHTAHRAPCRNMKYVRLSNLLFHEVWFLVLLGGCANLGSTVMCICGIGRIIRFTNNITTTIKFIINMLTNYI